MRGLPALSVLIACAVALSGCVTIKGQAEQQLDTIGSVEVTTTICLSTALNAPNTTCPDSQSNSQQDAGGGADAQLLVAYRVPAAVVAPPTISATYVSPQSGSVTLDQSPTYTSEMQQRAPAVAGERWVGYISPVIFQADQVPNARAHIVAELGLGRGGDGSPFKGPLHYRVVLGARGATTPDEAVRAVTCADTVTMITPNESTVCVDTPTPDESAFANDDRSLATRDLGILNGAAASTAPGHAVTMPFTIESVGLNGSPVFNLSAGTTVPGGSASPVQSVFAPDSTDATLPVSIGVPAGTPPGDYDVTLSANTSGLLRTGHGTLKVLAPGEKPPKPKVTLALGTKPKLGKALTKGLKLNVGCDVACSIKVKLGKFGSGKGILAAPGTKSITAKFSKTTRRGYRHRKKLKFQLQVSATGAGGTTVKKQSLTLRR